MSDLFSRLGSTAVQSVQSAVIDPFTSASPDLNTPLRDVTPSPAQSTATEGRPLQPNPRTLGLGEEVPLQARADAVPEPPPAAPHAIHESEAASDPALSIDETVAPASGPDPVGQPAVSAPVVAVTLARPIDKTSQADSHQSINVDRTAGSTPATTIATLRPAEPIFASAPSAAAAPTDNESRPTVRVHIGRLDVRANLEAAPAPQRAASTRNSRSESLSLNDYLAGRRVGS